MHFLKNLVPQEIKNIYHLIQAILANFWYGFPSRKIKVIGVTGTNGKTTTCQMIAKILEETSKKVAMISTINFKLGEKEWVNDTKYTTLSSFKVQKFIKRAVGAGCEYIILETSSHSLDQNRIWGINYDVAVITNVTREHLDYHKTMDEYRRAKLKLFKKAKMAVVNLDMENPYDFLQFNKGKKYCYTTQNQKLKIKMQNENQKCKIVLAENIELNTSNSVFHVSSYMFHVNMPGLFNIENALAATCVGLAEDVSLETTSRALAKIQGIPGRLEYVPNNKGFNIIIDYAVTPDSLEKLYRLVRETAGAKLLSRSLAPKIIAVFGACGERDRGKRPIMGEIVSKYADLIILTNEDPYNEDPWQIINEVASGVTPHPPTPSPDGPPAGEAGRGWPERPGEGKIENINAFRILDRREAIKKALQIAKPGDFVVITGKGAEETMAVGNKRIPWNDKKIIRELLQELK